MVARPWLALLALCALFDAPLLFLPEAFVPTAEPAVLLCAWLASLRLSPGAGRAARVALGLCAGVLVLVRVDRVAFMALMGEEPLLYDQLFMLRFLAVLISDVWTPSVALGLFAAIAAIVLLVHAVRRLLRAASALAARERRREASAGVALVGVALVLSSAPRANAAPFVHWMVPALRANVGESYAAYTRVQRGIRESPYLGYGALQIERPPDVYLVFVESYGRVMSTHDALRPQHMAQLTRMQQTLAAAGWSMASAFSRAPVMGGRSWLAEGSVIMGTRVRYEALFRQLVGQISRVPNLVGFLAGQGYTTIQLAPADRERPGVESVNYYRYARTLTFNDLNYAGPHRGWGIVPDQYSLEYVSEHVLSKTKSPLYFEFHMVSSHAPWDDLPQLVDDWRTLGQGGQAAPLDGGDNWVLARLRRFKTAGARRFARLGKLDDTMAGQYGAAIAYELSLLERHLQKLDRNALVILIGDHQPPFLSAETKSYDTPVHVLARDRRLLSEFVSHGFRWGLTLAPDARRGARHEGLFSLIVRQLVSCCSRRDLAPPYRWAGAKLGEADPEPHEPRGG
jgi:hypothetical protein